MESIRKDIAKIKENLRLLQGKKSETFSSNASKGTTIKLSSIKQSLSPDLRDLADRIASKKAKVQTITRSPPVVSDRPTPVRTRSAEAQRKRINAQETKAGDKIYYLSRCRVVRKSPKNALYVLVKKKKRYISNIMNKKNARNVKSCDLA